MNFRTTASALALVLASAGAAAAYPATVSQSLNVRSGPGTNYGIVDTLAAGSSVDVQQCRGSWCQVSGLGWASANYLEGVPAGAAYVVEESYAEPYGDVAFYYGDDSYYWDDAGYYYFLDGGRRHRVGWNWFHDHDRRDFRWTDNRHRSHFDQRWSRFGNNERGAHRTVRNDHRPDFSRGDANVGDRGRIARGDNRRFEGNPEIRTGRASAAGVPDGGARLNRGSGGAEFSGRGAGRGGAEFGGRGGGFGGHGGRPDFPMGGPSGGNRR